MKYSSVADDCTYVNLSDDTEVDTRKQRLLRDLETKQKERQEEDQAMKAFSDMLSHGIKVCSQDTDSNMSMHEKLYKSNLVASNLQKSNAGDPVFEDIEQTDEEEEDSSDVDTSLRSDVEQVIESAVSSADRLQEECSPTS